MALIKSISLICIAGSLMSHGNLVAARSRPSLGRDSHLIVEILNSVACADEPHNGMAIDYFRIGVRNKADYFVSGAFSVNRSAQAVAEVVTRLTKCRDSVSSNTCERNFQTWRLKKGVCKMLVDPNAMWKDVWNAAKPRMDCPLKPGHYTVDSYSIDTSLLNFVPFQWEGHVWQLRTAFMETPELAHICAELTFRVHRARTNATG